MQQFSDPEKKFGMSDHWKSLAEQLGAPGLSSSTKTTPPSETITSNPQSTSASSSESKVPSATEPVQAAAPVKSKKRSSWEALASLFNISTASSVAAADDAGETGSTTQVPSVVDIPPAGVPTAELGIFQPEKHEPANPALSQMFGEPASKPHEAWEKPRRVVDDLGWDAEDDKAAKKPLGWLESDTSRDRNRDSEEDTADDFQELSFRRSEEVDSESDLADEEEPLRRSRRRRRRGRGGRSTEDIVGDASGEQSTGSVAFDSADDLADGPSGDLSGGSDVRGEGRRHRDHEGRGEGRRPRDGGRRDEGRRGESRRGDADRDSSRRGSDRAERGMGESSRSEPRRSESARRDSSRADTPRGEHSGGSVAKPEHSRSRPSSSDSWGRLFDDVEDVTSGDSDLASDNPIPSEGGELAADAANPDVRSRRRRRRGRGRGRGSEVGFGSTAPDSDELDLVNRDLLGDDESGEVGEPALEELGFDSIESDVAGDAVSEAGRRRRRKRSRGGKSSGETVGENVSGGDAGDLSDETVDSEFEGDGSATKHRNIPTWEDSLACLIEANIENHRRNEGRGGGYRGGGGGGRGRGRR